MDFNSQNNNGRNKPGFPGLPTPPSKPAQGLPKPPSGIGKALPALPALPASMSLPKKPQQNGQPQERIPASQQPLAPTPAPQPVVQQVAPQPTSVQADFSVPEEQNYFEEPQEKNERASRRPSKTAKAKASRVKTLKPAKNTGDKKPSTYSGKRKNVMIARVAVFAIVGSLMLAGVTSFLPKASGLAAGDGPLIISKVRENLNVTDFPKTQGEGVALSFTQTYLNYDPLTKAVRYDKLKTYAAENILTQLEPRVATPEEVAQAQSATATVEEELPTGEATVGEGAGESSGLQTVTEGPYLVDSVMFKGGNAALFTTMTEVNNSNWVYLEIPMYYDDVTGAISVSGSLTFGSPVKTATVPDNEISSAWTNDREIEAAIKSDVANYMKAWTDSDTPGIERYLVKDEGKVAATQEAQNGLGGNVKFVSVSSLAVEGKIKPETGASAAQTADFQTREAEVKVNMLEPSSNLIYTVTYRIVIKYVNEDWFVEDIKNVSALLDRDEIISKKAATVAPEN